MKKQILGLGLAGLLSVIGANTNALEINEKGFPVPDKTNARLLGSPYKVDNRVTFKVYYNEFTGDKFTEFIVRDKIEAYVISPDRKNPSKDYMIQDNNCDGIFETKYTAEEFKNGIPVPSCYFNDKEKR